MSMEKREGVRVCVCVCVCVCLRVSVKEGVYLFITYKKCLCEYV